jgi:GTPase SAR1 family protein
LKELKNGKILFFKNFNFTSFKIKEFIFVTFLSIKNILFYYRMSELLEKANPGIVIALCGNKVDLEERQVSQEVILIFKKGSSKICK